MFKLIGKMAEVYREWCLRTELRTWYLRDIADRRMFEYQQFAAGCRRIICDRYAYGRPAGS